MSKTQKKRITLAEAIQNIPHDEFYCLDSGRCPYFTVRYLSENKYKALMKKGGIVPQYGKRDNKYPLEYCMFLRDYLGIQDGCKDCGINCDVPEEVAAEDKAYTDEYRANGEEPYASKDDEWLVKYGYMKKAYRRRIENREYADFYKEKLPEEIELIDRIVEEDQLEYWHKKDSEN